MFKGRLRKKKKKERKRGRQQIRDFEGIHQRYTSHKKKKNTYTYIYIHRKKKTKSTNEFDSFECYRDTPKFYNLTLLNEEDKRTLFVA